MKRNDIAMIVLIATTSVVVAFFVTQAIFNNITTDTVKVKTIEKISTTVNEPDPAIFNEQAINPTVGTQIGSAGQ